ncbi:hypothetical protein D3OALGA1CA_4993 [Olavius algarvensis associated proteobacterium Delta 3]|nr:hypothetical protein D3OALGA1CA_4993 [Olavius algarvensis associated proteobacterium Delta 3]
MVQRDDLKQIVMLTYLSDEMLDQLTTIVDILKFDREEVLFRQHQWADRFYMMRSGLILLEQKISEDVTAIVGSIKPGYSFGWSAMVEDGTYTVDAVCVEPSEVMSFKREKIDRMIQQYPQMGLILYQRLLVIIKKRLDYRTEQFRQAIMNHPEMQQLFAE